MAHRSNLNARALPQAILALATAGVSLPLHAEPVTFNPRFGLGRIYNSNVAYVSAGEDEFGDWKTSLRADLPVRKNMEHSSVELAYHLATNWYDDADVLNNVEHVMRFHSVHRISPSGFFNLVAFYTRTQDQSNLGRLEQDEGDDVGLNPFVSRRVQEDTYGATVQYQHRISETWRLRTSLTARVSNYDPLSSVDPDRLAVENRQGYRFRFGAGREISRRVAIETQYTFASAELEESGDETMHQVDAGFEYRFTERFATNFRFGVFRRENESTGDVSTGGLNFVDLRFNEGLIVGPLRFHFRSRVTPSAGGALIGTALLGSVSVTMSNLVPDIGPGDPDVRWRWDLYARYSRRVPFDDTLETTDTVAFGGDLERRLTRRLGLRFAASWVQQSGDTTASDAGFWKASAWLTYYPLRGTRIAQR
jgi:hypothetical protein